MSEMDPVNEELASQLIVSPPKPSDSDDEALALIGDETKLAREQMAAQTANLNAQTELLRQQKQAGDIALSYGKFWHPATTVAVLLIALTNSRWWHLGDVALAALIASVAANNVIVSLLRKS